MGGINIILRKTLHYHLISCI